MAIVKLNNEEIQDALHKADLLLRPYIIFINPNDKDKILLAMPDIEKSVVLETTNALEQGQAIRINREELEVYKPGVI